MLRPARVIIAGLLCWGLAQPVVAKDDAGDPGAWSYTMESGLLRDRIRLLIDDETALEAHMRFVGSRNVATAEGAFRDHALHVRCRRNPLVDALNCYVRVDGELRSNHVVIQ